MLRAAVFTLLVASILTGSLEAQRAGGAFHGGRIGGPAVRSGFVGQHGFSHGFFPQPGFVNGFFPAGAVFPNHFRFRRGAFNVPYFFPGYVPFFADYGPFFPDYGPLSYQQPYVEAPDMAPPLMLLERPDAEQSPRAVTPQVIEVPGAADSSASKALLPAIFILTNGERLESRRFVLTASNLSISIDRHQRTIPIDMLDLTATAAANRERGIELRIPSDRNEISLSF